MEGLEAERDTGVSEIGSHVVPWAGELPQVLSSNLADMFSESTARRGWGSWVTDQRRGPQVMLKKQVSHVHGLLGKKAKQRQVLEVWDKDVRDKSEPGSSQGTRFWCLTTQTPQQASHSASGTAHFPVKQKTGLSRGMSEAVPKDDNGLRTVKSQGHNTLGG